MEVRRMKYLNAILQSVAWCALFFVTCGQFETKWVIRFDAFGPGNYLINSIVSTKNDIYFAGTYTKHEGVSRCFLARYSDDGKPGWHVFFPTPEKTRAHGKKLLVLSKQEELRTRYNDIYLLVETHDVNGLEKAILAKYDSLGNLAWQKTAITTGATLTSTLLYDSDGNLYIAGWGDNKESRPTIFITKYSESGAVVYSTTYYSEQFDSDNFRFDITEPNLFVLAGLLRSTNELFYIKYNSSGQFQKMVNHKPESALKTISDLKIAPNGTIFISADISNPETSDDFLTLAFNSNDSLLWANEYDGKASGADHSKAISVDESLNVYVTGSAADARGNFNIVTVKYHISGDRLWAREIDQNKASNPLIMRPRYLHLGRSRKLAYLYTAGIIGSDAIILRCDNNGVYSFQEKYGAPGTVTVPTALTEKYVALQRTSNTGSDAFIVKYGPSAILGITRWD